MAKTKKSLKRILSLVLSIVMVFGMLNLTVLAADESYTVGDIVCSPGSAPDGYEWQDTDAEGDDEDCEHVHSDDEYGNCTHNCTTDNEGCTSVVEDCRCHSWQCETTCNHSFFDRHTAACYTNCTHEHGQWCEFTMVCEHRHDETCVGCTHKHNWQVLAVKSSTGSGLTEWVSIRINGVEVDYQEDSRHNWLVQGDIACTASVSANNVLTYWVGKAGSSGGGQTFTKVLDLPEGWTVDLDTEPKVTPGKNEYDDMYDWVIIDVTAKVKNESGDEVDFGETSATITATKILNGRDLLDGEFTFILTGASDNTKDVYMTATNVGESIIFEELTYEAAGDYHYTISEVQGSVDGVTYDTNSYNVTVTVTETSTSLGDYLEATVSSTPTFTNTYEEKGSTTGSLTISKVNDGATPDSVTVKVTGEGVNESVTLDASNGWTDTVTGLTVGETYDVDEVEESAQVEGYELAVSGEGSVVIGEDGGSATITNTYTKNPPDIQYNVDVEGKKTWNDNNNSENTRPEEITINLLADGVVKDSVTVGEKDGWAWSFTELPDKTKDGEEIVYTIAEKPVEGYDAIVSGYNVTNTNEDWKTATTEVSGTKTWDDNDNQDGIRPASITINLLADGEVVDTQEVEGTGNKWAYSFTNLDKYDGDGNVIGYTVSEEAVSDYSTTYSGYNITNSYTPGKTSVSGSKTWNDDENQDGKRPESITINLLADGEKIDSATVTAEDDWSWSFNDLPELKNGKEIKYTIAEEEVEGYTTSYPEGTYNVINDYATEKTEVSGTKTWADNNDQDGKRPESITINLLADGEKVESKTVTAEDNWSWSFTGLDKYAGGKEIVYTISEDVVEGYAATVNGYNVTNSYTTETTEVSGTKTWDDNDNQDGIRPASITINLLADGEQVASKDVTAADNWAYSFDNLPKYNNGAEIVYTIGEETVEGYEFTTDGYDAINTHTPETITVSGIKTWNDAENQDGKRPESITINLLADGEEIDSKTVTADDNWGWSFTELPKFAGGEKIVYTISEEAVEGYTTAVNGYNVTNTHEVEKTSVSGSKTWDDNDNQDGKRPESITINLLAGGEKVDSKTVTEEDGWSWSFTDLDKYNAGEEIVYTITEEAVEGYTTSLDGYNVTNSYAPDKTSVTVNKVWNDGNNADGIRPASISVNLLANGEVVGSTTLTAAAGWVYTWTELDKYADGEEITYAVAEASVPAGYTSGVSGYTITNTHAPETTSVSVSKVWVDDNNAGDTRPERISVNLYANGTLYGSVSLTEADGWAYTWSDLTKNANGAEIAYTVTEGAVEGYTSSVEGYTITNTLVEEPEVPEVPEEPEEPDEPNNPPYTPPQSDNPTETDPEPVEPEPVVTEPEPVEPEPVVTEPEPTPVEPEPTEPEPALVDLEDENVPLTELPEEDPPAEPPKEEEFEDIFDDEVPLADVPQTGDAMGIYAAMSLLSGLGLAFLGLKKKDEEA